MARGTVNSLSSTKIVHLGHASTFSDNLVQVEALAQEAPKAESFQTRRRAESLIEIEWEKNVAYENNNIFAKIIRGEMPSYPVYEDEHTLAFMDVMPQVPGHTLVIPKFPAEDMLDVDAEFLAATICVTQNIAAAVKKAFEAPGIMIAQLNGAAAGQTVFHLHFHILPRHDGIEFKIHARDMEDGAVLEAHAQRIRAAL